MPDQSFDTSERTEPIVAQEPQGKQNGGMGTKTKDSTLANTEPINKKPVPIQAARWLNERRQQMVYSVQEWVALQNQIRNYPTVTDGLMREIFKNFTLYRLTFTDLQFKAPKIEETLLETYFKISDTIPKLEKESQKRPLFLYTNPGLKVIKKQWDELASEQQYLLGLLAKAPRGMEFFNQMRILREEKRIEEQKRREEQAKIDSAYTSLKKAMSYIERQVQNDEPVQFGNEVLTLKDAQGLWDRNLEEIMNLNNEDGSSTQTIVDKMRSLEDTVREYPTLIKQIARINERFSRLLAYHDLLTSYGKKIIPQAEIARASAMMYEQIPGYWTTGQYGNLKIILERVENFLNFYENSVELEVAIGERRRTGFTQALNAPALPNTSGLSPMFGLTRVLVAAIDQRDRFMVGHSESVAKLTVQIGRKMNWTGSDLEYLEMAALLHDVGKISIPEAILTKVKPLTNQEWKMIQMHPYYGAQIVKQITAFSRIVPWIYHHQEHWDGTGYPDQLTKKDIPLASSIIALTEAFTVMTTDLAYRGAISKQDAIGKIKEESGKQFNPEVVEAFLECMKEAETTVEPQE